LTTDEFVSTYLGAIPELDMDEDIVFVDSPYEVSTSVNWVTKGAVTPVKN
jgi:hypothetical protein